MTQPGCSPSDTVAFAIYKRNGGALATCEEWVAAGYPAPGYVNPTIVMGAIDWSATSVLIPFTLTAPGEAWQVEQFRVNLRTDSGGSYQDIVSTSRASGNRFVANARFSGSFADGDFATIVAEVFFELPAGPTTFASITEFRTISYSETAPVVPGGGGEPDPPAAATGTVLITHDLPENYQSHSNTFGLELLAGGAAKRLPLTFESTSGGKLVLLFTEISSGGTYLVQTTITEATPSRTVSGTAVNPESINLLGDERTLDNPVWYAQDDFGTAKAWIDYLAQTHEIIRLDMLDWQPTPQLAYDVARLRQGMTVELHLEALDFYGRALCVGVVADNDADGLPRKTFYLVKTQDLTGDFGYWDESYWGEGDEWAPG